MAALCSSLQQSAAACNSSRTGRISSSRTGSGSSNGSSKAAVGLSLQVAPNSSSSK